MKKEDPNKEGSTFQQLRKSIILIWRLRRYIFRYRKIALAILFFSNMAIILSLAVPYTSKLIVDYGIMRKDMRSFIVLGIVAMGIFMLGLIFDTWHDYLKNYMAIRIEADLNRDVFKRLKTSPLSLIQEVPGGVNLYRITTDIVNTTSLIDSTFINFINVLLKGIAISIIILFINPLLIIVLFFSQLLSIAKLAFLVKPINRMQKAGLEKEENIFGALSEFFSRIYVVKVFGTFGRETIRYMHSLFQDLRLQLKRKRLTMLSGFLAAVSDKLFFGTVTFFAAFLVIKGRVTAGTMTAAFLYLFQGANAYSSLIDLAERLAGNKVCLERIADLLEQPGHKGPYLAGRALPPDMRKIEFRNITFGYLPDKDILKNLNFTIEAGAHIGLVGPSGIGKTTILNLILGLYQPKSGYLLLGGENLGQIDQKHLLGNIGVALQEPFLFNASIAYNIGYGLRSYTKEDILLAAGAVGIVDVINSLPDKFDTVIGENAYRLSQGQKQRLAIARALIKKPQILILDEAMSSLDVDSEEKIIAQIRDNFIDSTLIVVSHRVSVIRQMNVVYYLKESDALYLGPHRKLIEELASYRQLFRLSGEKGTSMIAV